jgi:class 3 adenylate cyclase
MPNLPSGTVTFLFSDIEGSTALLKQLGDAAYTELLGQHRRLVRAAFASHDGQEIDTQGDAFFYSFPRARQAVVAAVEVQRAHAAATWPGGVSVRVRIGLHTGEPAVGEEGYTGLDVVRAARIAAVGHGGQILLSETTRALVGTDLPEGVALHSVGEQRLKDIDRPEPLHELTIEGLTPESEPMPPAAAEAGPMTPAPSGAPPSVPARRPGDDAVAEVAEAFRSMPEWVKRVAKPFVPSPERARDAIEARVLAEIEKAWREDGDLRGREAGGTPVTQPETKRHGSSVADEIDRLRAMRDAGALSEEQYRRAVDRVVGEG